jgi:5'-deoxynucleotidase YfbR-like HD superfamily hydrolase
VVSSLAIASSRELARPSESIFPCDLRGKLTGARWRPACQPDHCPSLGRTALAIAHRKPQHPFLVVAQNKEMLRAADDFVVQRFGDYVLPREADIAADIFALLEGFALQQVRRYFHHRFWAEESTEADFADRAEPGLKLENVAAHSWHVADTTLLVLDHFEWLNRERCLSLALLHDKMEMYTGDANPVGRDGTGLSTHAFHELARSLKTEREIAALIRYASALRSQAAERQVGLLLEIINGDTDEARLVKAIDKLQALAFVHLEKRGALLDSHIRFTLAYSHKCCEYFPPLRGHYQFLRNLFLQEVACRRGATVTQLERDLFSQLELDLSSWSRSPESE